ncbi:hypothetical protein EYF80_013376 [Liparis tanakae]|uniref:Uncharacterized protein n=1 Tax=Liparis tanakae TaxID=230148 RepID=A0A4Z2IFF0_9TELE|nr:hypothetical protein EYF80_013376 [Liparis tanakae]
MLNNLTDTEEGDGGAQSQGPALSFTALVFFFLSLFTLASAFLSLSSTRPALRRGTDLPPWMSELPGTRDGEREAGRGRASRRRAAPPT